MINLSLCKESAPFWAIVLLINGALCLDLKGLYPFGTQDERLSKEPDISSTEIQLSVPIVHYQNIFSSIYVNDNGLLSFMTEVPIFFNAEFPLSYPIISPMYSNVDTSVNGVVYYRETKERELLDRATQTANRYFSSGRGFRAQSLFIATWSEVGRSEQQSAKKNTVQTVVASNGTQSFAFFLYPENGIQWVQGEGILNNLPDAFTQAGFISGDGRYYKLPGSGTEQVKNYPKMSNINQNGFFAFHIGNTGVGNVILPDKDYDSPLDLNQIETCSLSKFPCLPSADCLEYSTGICCQCQRGYYGNGRSCLKNDEHVRVNGKLSGLVNDIELEDVDVHAYVETKAGRVYTGISNMNENLGYDMQTASAALSIAMSWMFAVPVGESPNGFTLTGGIFNRTVDISFPQTGHHAVIMEQYLGLNVFNSLNLKVGIRGSLPTIPSDSSVKIEDYDQEFTRVSLGLLKSRFTHSFSFGENSLNMPIVIDQTISFNECPHKLVDSEPLVSRLNVARNYIIYDKNILIVRYASDSKISFLSENNACSSVRCGSQSTCVVEGSSYRCVCNRGFEQIFHQDLPNDVNNPYCVDIDECSTRGAICHQYAECINEPGSYKCRCGAGFVGDGYNCQGIENECNNMQCDVNAKCIQARNLGPRCLCKDGYFGNGFQCSKIEEDISDCRSINLCDLNADCKLNSLNGRYSCICKAGFRGDGIVCMEESESCEKMKNCGTNAECISDETSNHAYYCSCNPGYVGDGYTCVAEINVDDCSILNNCHRYASCVSNPNTAQYQCQCNAGFAGNGYRCYNSSYFNPCQSNQECSPYANCVSDEVTQSNICRCNDGYVGNGLLCTRSNECNPIEPNCDQNANCVYNEHTLKHECQCKLSFHGDGMRCVPDESVDCKIVNNCNANASCVVDPHSLHYYCECNAGFEGDGRSCKEYRSCDKLNNCDVHAECKYDPSLQNFRCQCFPDFVGDGFKCKPRLSCREDRSICDRNADCIYIDHIKDVTCHCHYGFIGDGYQCSPAPVHQGDYIIFSQGMSILRMPLEGNREDNRGYPLFTRSNQIPVGLDVDCLNGYIYWSDVAKGNIHKAAYNGSGSDRLLLDVTNAPEGLSIDWVSRNIYWTDSFKHTIEVSNLEGSLHKVLINEELINPRGIAVHPGSGKLYWSDWNRDAPKIEYANLDGTQRSVLINTDLKLPNNLVVDFEHNDLCWTDAGLHRIECVNLYTKSRRIISSQASYPFDITISQNNIYWTDWETKSIHQIDRNGGVAERLEIPLGGHGRLYGIVTVPKHCPRISNACSVNNGGCKHLCLPNERGRTCACPDNAYDEDDNCS